MSSLHDVVISSAGVRCTRLQSYFTRIVSLPTKFSGFLQTFRFPRNHKKLTATIFAIVLKVSFSNKKLFNQSNYCVSIELKFYTLLLAFYIGCDTVTFLPFICVKMIYLFVYILKLCVLYDEI